jgi:hypothetical protein
MNAATMAGDVAQELAQGAGEPVRRERYRANVLGRVRSSEIRQPETAMNIEFAGVRDDVVVIMGEETVRPAAAMPNAGKIVRRRFTDLWRQIGGVWKLAIRQSTIVSVD